MVEYTHTQLEDYTVFYRKHASSHVIGDDYRPINREEEMQYAILLELRALNAHFASRESNPLPAAPRRDAPQASHAKAALPTPKKSR